MPDTDTYYIDNLDQLESIVSPVRQEILDTVLFKGSCTIGDIAEEIGRNADGLYFHIRALVKVGLLVKSNSSKIGIRQESNFSIVDDATELKVKYNQGNQKNVLAINKMVHSMLKIAKNDFDAGFHQENVALEGEFRNLWACRIKGRLSTKEVKEVNSLLHRLMNIFQGSQNRKGNGLHSLVWVLAPVISKPKRRQSQKD